MNNNSLKNHIISSFKNDINIGKYYIVAGKSQEWTNDSVPDAISYKLEDIYNTKKNFIYGKKVESSDIKFLIKRNIWSTNKTYDSFDLNNDDIYNLNFFVINSENDIFVCIHNNYGTPSTIEPLSVSLSNITLSDGYVWKYIYSISDFEMKSYSNEEFIPVVANSVVSSASVPGTIEYVQVLNSSNNITNNSGRIQLKVSPNIFKIENSASNITNFYQNTLLYISGGTAAGNFSNITESFANSSGIYIKTSDNLNLAIDSEYQISPTVKTTGDGSGFSAISKVNANNEVYQILILNKGSNYTSAKIEIIDYNNTVTLHPLISPIKGHGVSPDKDFYADRFVVKGEFNSSENVVYFPKEMFKYRQISLVYDPNITLVDNNLIYYSSTFQVTGPFDLNETVKGLTSNSIGTVFFSNNTHTKLNYVTGLFQENETILGENSNKSGTITFVKNPNVQKSSGEIIQYINSNPINRLDNTSEKIKFIMEIKG